MYPNSKVHLLRNVPLDIEYKHTRLFNDLEEQYSYFASKVIISLEAGDGYTYQREVSSIRADQNINKIRDCNYVMYRNENDTTKWFYAFVQELQYVNEETTNIVIVTDYMQSYLFDYQIKTAYVEREHTSNDSIGANTIPEGLELGGYITTNKTEFLIDGLRVFMMVSELVEEPGVVFNEGGTVGGLPIPFRWADLGFASNGGTFNLLSYLLEKYAVAGKTQAVISIFTAPNNFVSLIPTPKIQGFNLPSMTLPISVRNNKLKTYPYTALAVTAGGNGIELKYELFGQEIAMRMTSGFGENMTIHSTPLSYAGEVANYDYSLSLTDFPLIPYSNEYYQNWLAQNKAQLTTSVISGSVTTGIGALGTFLGGMALAGATVATGGIGGLVAGAGVATAGLSSVNSGITNIASTLAEKEKHSIIPSTMVGSALAGDILAISNQAGFRGFCRTIRPEYMRQIDDYFTMFGYQTNRLKVPNLKSREHFNFIKVSEILIEGSCTTQVKNILQSIFKKGITFWHTNDVGNYTLDNNIR